MLKSDFFFFSFLLCHETVLVVFVFCFVVLCCVLCWFVWGWLAFKTKTTEDTLCTRTVKALNTDQWNKCRFIHSRIVVFFGRRVFFMSIFKTCSFILGFIANRRCWKSLQGISHKTSLFIPTCQ